MTPAPSRVDERKLHPPGELIERCCACRPRGPPLVAVHVRADAAEQKIAPAREAFQHRHVEQHTLSWRAVAVVQLSVPDEPRGQAEVLIPHGWLLPNLSLDAVRRCSAADTTSDLEKGDLRLAGVEVLVARNWVKEEFWPRIQDAVQKGYAAEKTYTFHARPWGSATSRRPKKST